MTSAPLVSICVPVYNGGDLLPAALDCLLGQTYKNLDAILCDDASTDGSREICERYARRDSRVRVLVNEANLGLVGNYNRVVAAAAGKYVIVRSDNDLLHESFVAAAVDYMESDATCGLCYARTTRIDATGAPRGTYPDEWYIDTVGLSRRDGFRAVVGKFFAGDMCYGLMRAEFLRKVQSPSWHYGADHVLAAEIALYSSIKLIDRLWNFRRDNNRDSNGYAALLSRRLHRSGRREPRPVWEGFDVAMYIPCTQMTFHHVRMVSEARLTEAEKITLAEDARNILRGRFGADMLKEIARLCQVVEVEFDQFARDLDGGVAPLVSAHIRLLFEEMILALAMAQLVFPEHEAARVLRRKLLACL